MIDTDNSIRVSLYFFWSVFFLSLSKFGQNIVGATYYEKERKSDKECCFSTFISPFCYVLGLECSVNIS